jgi:8-oxo-dGTP pyrophosphatase MutT (NUDIX family)
MMFRLQSVLSARHPKHIEPGARTPAAILIPIYQNGNDYFAVFTERTRYVSTHKGQISFPGGSRDPEDESLAETALRECEEEIGLPRSSVRILGQLDDCLTFVSSYVITPFVGEIPWPHLFRANPLETAKILEIPISQLVNPASMSEGSEIVDDTLVPAYFYSYPGGSTVIWGATARILNQFLETWRDLIQSR